MCQEPPFPSRAGVWVPCPATGEAREEAHSPVAGAPWAARTAAIVAQAVGREAGRIGLPSWTEEVRKEGSTGSAAEGEVRGVTYIGSIAEGRGQTGQRTAQALVYAMISYRRQTGCWYSQAWAPTPHHPSP